jgi:ABC-type transport system substrate-binding protein
MMPIPGSNFRLYNKRLAAFVVLLLALMVLQMACGGGAAEPTPVPQPATSTPEATNAPSAEATATPQSEEGGAGAEPTAAPVGEDEGAPATGREGVLRVAMQPIVQTDPALISSDSEVLVANHVYDYLVDIDPQSQPVPRLATDWEVSDDGLTYTFNVDL